MQRPAACAKIRRTVAWIDRQYAAYLLQRYPDWPDWRIVQKITAISRAAGVSGRDFDADLAMVENVRQARNAVQVDEDR